MTIQLHGIKTTGLVPIGGVVATIPALAGAYSCAATTEADDLGYVKCNGQVINDPTSPLNGLTIPNINDDVFLKGHTTSNSAGGSNTHDHTVPGHYHYWGGHWSTDRSDYNHDPYGNGIGNQYQDGYGYRGNVASDGSHYHYVCPGNFGADDGNLFDGTNQERVQMADAPDNDISIYADTAGAHSHVMNQHRHWIQTRTTHGGSLDGRNTMTSGSSSTQPKYITVLYVMRIK